MTTTPTTGDLRARLAAAITRLWEAEAGEPLDDLDVAAESRDLYVDALLPVVESYGRACAATALRDDADDDTGYVVWALADDWLTEHPPEDGLVESEDVHDWLVKQGRNLGAR